MQCHAVLPRRRRFPLLYNSVGLKTPLRFPSSITFEIADEFEPFVMGQETRVNLTIVDATSALDIDEHVVSGIDDEAAIAEEFIRVSAKRRQFDQ
jgi:hypothetical protein